MTTKYLLIKRGLYWRPDSCGYTGLKREAGRYDETDASCRCHDEGTPFGVTMIAEEDAHYFSPSCPGDVKQREIERALLRALTMGAQLNTPDLLDWVADRLVHVYGENPNVDFVQSLRLRAEAGRAAIAMMEGR